MTWPSRYSAWAHGHDLLALPRHPSGGKRPRALPCVRATRFVATGPSVVGAAAMSVHLRRENCCETEGCMKPAYYGELCAACWFAASPARRAAELLADEAAAEPVATPQLVGDEGVAWLEQVWAT